MKISRNNLLQGVSHLNIADTFFDTLKLNLIDIKHIINELFD